jgi:hypothetical protein
MGVTDFTLSLRQLDRWFAGELTKPPRPSVSLVAETEFGYPVEVLLAPETEAPLLAPLATASSRQLRTGDFIAWIADRAGYPLTDVYAAVSEAADRLDAEPFAVQAQAEHARASHARTDVAAAVHSYYGGPSGFYTASVGDTTLSLSMLVEPGWLDLAIPLDDDHQHLQLDRCSTGSRPRALSPVGVHAAIERLATVECGTTILLDNPLYQLLSLDLTAGRVDGRLGLTSFADYALTGDLLEGELLDSLTEGSNQAPRMSLPLRDLYLPTKQAALAFDGRVCAGGPACLLAIARPDDYLLVLQKRSGRVVNVAGRLAVIPKAFHQPMNDDQETSLSATVDRELEEELLGRADLEQIVAEDSRRAGPRHREALSEPMRWLVDHARAYQVETTAFGVNMLTGNYEFACLVVVEDPAWWDRYGHRVAANWEAARVLCYSSCDRDGLTHLAVDPTWSNEGLFALLEGLRRLSERCPAKTATPPIGVVRR